MPDTVSSRVGFSATTSSATTSSAAALSTSAAQGSSPRAPGAHLKQGVRAVHNLTLMTPKQRGRGDYYWDKHVTYLEKHDRLAARFNRQREKYGSQVSRLTDFFDSSACARGQASDAKTTDQVKQEKLEAAFSDWVADSMEFDLLPPLKKAGSQLRKAADYYTDVDEGNTLAIKESLADIASARAAYKVEIAYLRISRIEDPVRREKAYAQLLEKGIPAGSRPDLEADLWWDRGVAVTEQNGKDARSQYRTVMHCYRQARNLYKERGLLQEMKEADREIDKLRRRYRKAAA